MSLRISEHFSSTFGLKTRRMMTHWQTAIAAIFISLILLSACGEEAHLESRYARMRQLFPELPQNEKAAKYWTMARSDKQQHPCQRKCVANATMICYYYLVVHYDETMGASCQRYLQKQHRYKVAGKEYLKGYALREHVGYDDCKYADGVKSKVIVINGLLPGPPIEVCQGDTIVADVVNSLHEPTSIHWHGLRQQQTPHMDGVPHISQYPIEAGQAYRYRFQVDRVGTNYWHSHVAHQRAFGLAGALIIRQPAAENPHVNHYDFDLPAHVLLLQDWVHNFDLATPQNILINGLGRNVGSADSSPEHPTLYSSFSVERGGRYRFRVIFNGVSNCPISLSVDAHELQVIATDGHDVEPMSVKKLTMNAGERYDFVLHADQKVDNYWLRVKGYKFCASGRLHQAAVLHYEGAKRTALPKGTLSYAYEPKGLELNAIGEVAPTKGKHATVLQLHALAAHAQAAPARQWRTFHTSMSISNRDGYRFQMDDISFQRPSVSLMQARNLGIGAQFCNKTQLVAQGRNCRSEHCRCLNVLHVPAAEHVEFVISSTDETTHPIHLHGYSFRVVGMGVLGEGRIEQIEKMDRRTPLPRRSRGAPLKDTVQVPGFGYTIIRFYTDNPGYWLLHCHHSAHAENGMAAVLRVGEHAHMKLCPVSNCGLCSSAP